MKEDKGIDSVMIRHSMTMEEEGLVTIIANVDQEARIVGMRFGISGVKCSVVFKAASLWKTAPPKIMCKMEVDLEDFVFPQLGGQPRNLSLWRDVQQDEISFFSMDNNNEGEMEGEDAVMETIGEAELSLRAVIVPLDVDRAEVIIGAIPVSSSRVENLWDIPGTEKIPMLPVLQGKLSLDMGPKVEDSHETVIRYNC